MSTFAIIGWSVLGIIVMFTLWCILQAEREWLKACDEFGWPTC